MKYTKVGLVLLVKYYFYKKKLRHLIIPDPT